MASIAIEVIGWTIAITPDYPEEWPVTADSHGYPARPDLVLINVQPGGLVQLIGSGRRQRRDGTEGLRRVDMPWSSLADLPDWAAVLAGDALNGVQS